MRSSTVPALMTALLAACAVLPIGALFALLIIAKPTKAAPTDDSVVAVAGLRYEAMLGRQIRPANAFDAPMVAGPSARVRHLRSPGPDTPADDTSPRRASCCCSGSRPPAWPTARSSW
jgi:hypothetical protein